MQCKQHEDNFEVLERVGVGGYGSVFKVRNKLDERVYALKKIKLEATDLLELEEETQKVLKECRTLSLLNHPNILRYYGSWLNHVRNNENRAFDSVACSPKNRISRLQQAASFGYRLEDIERLPNRGGLTMTAIIDDEDLNLCKESPIMCRRLLIDEEEGSNESLSIPKGDPTEDVLYIQTEFCDASLEQYLEERAKLLRKCQKVEACRLPDFKHDLEIQSLLLYEAFSIALQLIQALKYIHLRQKLIHRDLKPSNIFMNIGSRPRLTPEGLFEVKLGDFGLVKKLRHVRPSSPFANNTTYVKFIQDCPTITDSRMPTSCSKKQISARPTTPPRSRK